MKFLIVNDDGITSKGIEILARHAKEFGSVTVVAPSEQCSAMSQRVTIGRDLKVKQEPFPVEGVEAYSVDGTPADCVIVATDYLLKERPDFVFSGINHGYNLGFDIAYSGTLGATSEAVMRGLPAMAFSNHHNVGWELVEEHLSPVIAQLLKAPLPAGHIWNVNFPGCAPEACQGVLTDREVSHRTGYYNGVFQKVGEAEDGGVLVRSMYQPLAEEDLVPGSDIEAIEKNYIAIGLYKPGVL